MPRQVVLLRGINLGSSRRIAMADLRELLTAAGHEDVRTHLQSGNVVLSSEHAPAALERMIAEQILARLGMEVPVLVRTRDELADVVRRNPLGAVANDPKRLQVSFLSAEPAPAVVRELESVDIAPEQIAVSGREIYVWHANGIQKSPAAALISDRRLGVTATARNWNTVTRLLELADA